MTPLPLSTQTALALTVLIAALCDIRSRSIPNWLTGAAVLAGLLLHPLSTGWAGAKLAAGGLGLAALIFLPLFFMRWLGGGDVKLMGAVGALAGATNLLVVFLIDSVLAGAVALVLVLLKGRVRRTLRNIASGLASLARGRAPYRDNEQLEAGSEKSFGMPRAVTIAIATLLVLWVTPR